MASELDDGDRVARATSRRAVRFYSRLPVPALPFEDEPHGPPDTGAHGPASCPLAGLAIGLRPGPVSSPLALALALGPWLAAALAVAALTPSPGAFHEDGLADTADGFGGGADPGAAPRDHEGQPHRLLRRLRR